MTDCKIIWTPELRAEALKMISEGISGTKVALHYGVTRNVIAGMVARAGIKRHRWPPNNPIKPKIVKSEKPIKNVFSHKNYSLIAVPASSGSKPPRSTAISRQNTGHEGVDIMNLTLTTCRWPMWPTEALYGFYCGAECGVIESYCEQHSKSAYRVVAQPEKAVVNA